MMALQQQQRGPQSLQPGDTLIVVHDFDARSSDELTLRKSERVELIELDDGFGDGWFLGRHLTRGDTGLFPGVYTSRFSSNNSPSRTTTTGGPIISIHSPKEPTNQIPSFSNDEPRSTWDQGQDRLQEQGNSNGYPAPAPFDGSHNLSNTAATVHLPLIQRSIGQALNEDHRGEDSPVMNETLSVIEEHIDDLRTPRQSLAPQQPIREDSASDYSKDMDRASFVAGTDGEGEEGQRPTEDDVRGWDPKQTAVNLRSLGVDSRHCDIFEEQEITGEVLLDMDQSFLFMKEYDFGVMGRRLKTWHKIREFQNLVRGFEAAPFGAPSVVGLETPDEAYGNTYNHMSPQSTLLPRIPSLMENPGLGSRQSAIPGFDAPANMPAPLQTQSIANASRAGIATNTPPSPWRASMIAESPSRPSAALIRELSHSRRHSYTEFGLDQPANSVSMSSPHKHQNSYDRTFSLTSGTPTSANTTAPSLGLSNRKGSEDLLASSMQSGSPVDLDRGYFSGNEADNRKHRSILRKRDSALITGHSRQASNPEAQPRVVNNVKAHTRYSSVDSTRNFRPVATSPAAQAYHSTKTRYRSASTRGPPPVSNNPMLSPTVTNLEDMSSPSLSSRVSSPNTSNSTQHKARKLFGLRATSDSVTGSQKSLISAPTTSGAILEKNPVESPTGSSTASAHSQSFEIDNTDISSRGTEATSNALVTRTSDRSVPKNKRQTSAYTHGLLKLSPAEARKDCDHYGWMKKKSSGIMTTWKPRFFVLRGRRLSYYYSETEVEERGIIDISGHKVLVANSEPMTTLHAQITGATSSPPTAATESNGGVAATRSPGSSPFYFKLVPPKGGLSRAVQFTRPTVHYFQCSSLKEGRKWMGEIMKATIEHDVSSFETTNKQKTISLAKARARKERPPFLGGTEDNSEVLETEEEGKADRKSGLNIQGLQLSLDMSSPFEVKTDPMAATADSEQAMA